MYRISKKMLKNGEILDRGQYFYLFGYEYTLRLSSDDMVIDSFTEWFEPAFKGRLKYHTEKKEGTLVVRGYDYQFELIRHRREGQDVMFHAFFSRWEENSYDIFSGNDMNKLLTGLEMLLLRLDPLTWVRDMWVPRSVVGHNRTFEIWQTKYPSYRLTPEDIKEKNYSNGRPFEELYLADRLRSYGVNVYGGSSVSPTGSSPVNPLVAAERSEAAEKMQEVKKAEEEKKAEAARPKICPSCGNECQKGVRNCPFCGARFQLTREEKKAEEVTKKEYPMFFIREAVDQGDPYIYPHVDAELNPVAEWLDGTPYAYQLDGITLYRSLKDEKGFTEIMKIMSRDNYLYITDSRVVLLNKKYNKNENGSWIGLGGLSAMIIGESMTAVGRAVESAKRQGKALIGMLRYEWISFIRYKEKTGALSYPELEIYYEDINRTNWCIKMYLIKSEGGAYAFADYLIHKIALLRAGMDDDKSEELQSFIEKYSDPNVHIPMPSQEGKAVRVDVPVFYFATKGKPFCPWYY